MRLPVRVLSFGALLVVLLSLPSIGLAADPKGPGGGPSVTLSGGNVVAGPTLVPGAMVGSVGLSDPFAYGTAAGATIVTVVTPAAYYQYNSPTGSIFASLRLPAGATLWQVDVYGYTTGATTQAWILWDENMSTSAFTDSGSPSTPSGPGIVHGTMTFASGLTLAAGHEWFLQINPTSLSSGYIGAIFQYTLPTLSLVPMTPVRVFDSRFSSRIVQGAPRTINVKNAINVVTGAVTISNAIPKGARAISFTITATGTGAAGYVLILPGTSTALTASTINWTGPGATLATGGIVSLGTGAAERQVTLVVGGAGSASTDVILDITGYFK